MSQSPLWTVKPGSSNLTEKNLSWSPDSHRECQICSSLSTDMISLLSALLLGLWIKKTPHFLSQSAPFLLWLRFFFLQLQLFSSVVIPLPRQTGFNLFYSSKELRSEQCLSLLCLRLSWNVKGRNSLICSISNQLHQWTNRLRFQWIVPCTFMHNHPPSNSLELSWSR